MSQENIRYYIAYGSNLYKTQMQERCPEAKEFGKMMLKDFKLVYRKSNSGYYLSIDKKIGSMVPVVIYIVSESDEKSLDRYEGYPKWYSKENINLTLTPFNSNKEVTVNAFYYYLDSRTCEVGIPKSEYVERCKKGYKDFELEEKYLDEAYEYSKENDGKYQI